MTLMQFWRALCADDDRRLLKVTPQGAIVGGDAREWVRVRWPWGDYTGLFPLDEAGLEQAKARLVWAEQRRRERE